MRARIIVFVSIFPFGCVKSHVSTENIRNGKRTVSLIATRLVSNEFFFYVSCCPLSRHSKPKNEMSYETEQNIITPTGLGSPILAYHSFRRNKLNLWRIHWDQFPHSFIDWRFIYCSEFVSIWTDLGYSIVSNSLFRKFGFYVVGSDDGISSFRFSSSYTNSNTIRHDRTNQRTKWKQQKKMS